jgi:hypothetical protein
MTSLLSRARGSERTRAIVTGDLADSRPLLAAELRRLGKLYGLVRVPGPFELSRDGIGRLVRALDALLAGLPRSHGRALELWRGG